MTKRVDEAERRVDEIDATHWDCLAGPPVTRAEIIFWIVLFCGVTAAYLRWGS